MQFNFEINEMPMKIPNSKNFNHADIATPNRKSSFNNIHLMR